MIARLILCLAACASVASAIATPVAAQQPVAEIIRGRVTDDSARGVANATVMVTRGPDRLTLPATVDCAGNYRVKFDEGTGDYLVYVSAVGFKPARRRVQRQGNEHEFVADFALARDLTLLAASKTVADRPVRATNNITPTSAETGASERWSDGVNGQISPTIAGDLNAIAGTMSNVTMTPGGPSILGSASSSNLTTLNGMGLAAGAIPRAARTETRVTGATFDATRGGFCRREHRRASRDRATGSYQRRNGFITLDPPAFQFTDPATRALGAPAAAFAAALARTARSFASALTYNVALDVARSTSDPATLIDAQSDALLRAGASPDSVARLIALAPPLGLSLSRQRRPREPPAPGHHVARSLRRHARHARARARSRRTSATRTTERSALVRRRRRRRPASDVSARSARQLTLGNFVGAERRILTETRFGRERRAHAGHAVPRRFPVRTVLVRSSSARSRARRHRRHARRRNLSVDGRLALDG